MSTANRPKTSKRPDRKRASFAFKMGAKPDLRGWNGLKLLEAPVNLVEEGYANKYGRSVRFPRGRVSLEFVSQILEGKIRDLEALVEDDLKLITGHRGFLLHTG